MQNEKLMAQEKERILKYLKEQLDLKIEALKAYEMPIQDLKEKSPAELESWRLRHDIYELKKHISVIEML